jgi:hypothetical protein
MVYVTLGVFGRKLPAASLLLKRVVRGQEPRPISPNGSRALPCGAQPPKKESGRRDITRLWPLESQIPSHMIVILIHISRRASLDF